MSANGTSQEELMQELVRVFHGHRTPPSQANRAFREAMKSLRGGVPSSGYVDAESVLQSCQHYLKSTGKEGEVRRFLELYETVAARHPQALSLVSVLAQCAGHEQSSRMRPVRPSSFPAAVQKVDEGPMMAKFRDLDVANRGSSTKDEYVSEAFLVREVLYCCQGINGKYIFYNEQRQTFSFAERLNLSTPTVQLARRLCELGWLYIHIQGCLRGMGQRSQEAYRQGSVGQAFVVAVQTELAEYFRYLAALESRTIGHGAGNNKNAGSTFSTAEPHHALQGNELTTLRQLSAWLVEPFQRLRSLATLVDVAQEHKGGALLGALHGFTKSGDPRTEATAKALLSEAAAPFYETLQKWVVDGELDDPFEEFFVGAKTMDPHEEKEFLWRYKFFMVQGMRPSFVREDIAHATLHVGKCINFLRHTCNDLSWVEERKQIESHATTAGGLRYGNERALEAMVLFAKERVNARVQHSLFSSYRLGEHCNAIKRYLLLGQGDFIQYLMDLVGRDLESAAPNVVAYKLDSSLDVAVRSSNAQFEDQDIINRLGIKLLEPAGGELGWDVFSLDYQVPAPLRTIFDENAKARYLRIFNFLWRMKRVEHNLNQSWQRLKPNHALQLESLRRTRAERLLSSDFRRCHALRAEMAHFVENLSFYIMFEVLERCWSRFQEEVAQARDLDALITSHEAFLDNVMRASLLDDSSEALRNQLDKLFDTILTFAGITRRLHDTVEDIYRARGEVQARAEERQAQGRWAMTREETAETGELQNQLQQLHSQIEEVAKEYSNHLEHLLQLLPLQKHVDLTSLAFRLDFSHFYS